MVAVTQVDYSHGACTAHRTASDISRGTWHRPLLAAQGNMHSFCCQAHHLLRCVGPRHGLWSLLSWGPNVRTAPDVPPRATHIKFHVEVLVRCGRLDLMFWCLAIIGPIIGPLVTGHGVQYQTDRSKGFLNQGGNI